jgi:O-antigen ligase
MPVLARPAFFPAFGPAPANRALAWQRELATGAATLLTGILFAALIIGDRPFAPDTADKAAITESGSSFNRSVIFLAAAGAVPMLLVRLEETVRLLRRNWPIWAYILLAAASFAWASHPDLVLRRAFAYTLVYIALLGLAVSARRALDWLVPLAAVFALVTLLNIVAMLAFPAASWSPIGETGIFDNKNGAGTMAMLAIVILGTALAACRSNPLRLGLVLIIGLAWLFLLATRSKTSIGVAGLMMLAGPALYLLLASPAALRVAALAAGVAVLAFGTTAFYASGFDDADLRLLLFGDLTFTGRTAIWEHLVPEIARQPWLGHGFGSFWDTGATLNPIRSAPASAWFMQAQLINTAHNGYLDLLIQTGIVGLALGVIAILRCLWLLAAAAAGQGVASERVALTGAFCVAFCLMLNNFLESYLFRTGDTLGFLFIFLMLHGEAARLRERPA